MVHGELSTRRPQAGREVRRAMGFRIGQGFDSHPLVSGRRLMLGGVEVPHDRGLGGHSDADVLTHALANAILGAIGEGDLGRHFPDSDPRWAGVDSLRLLDEVAKLAAGRGYRLVNADMTVFAQRPRLGPYLGAMRDRLASVLGVEAGRLNVKASSPEGLGALGRAEGMSASATVLLEGE
jgi:2-C-methyl-D-erythritol 2,4-cyclodiphosphate synthase